MQKIKRGKQFAGVVLYSLKSGSHHKITPYIIGGNMTGSTAAELISEFEGTRLLRPGVAKPVWHNSLRLPKGETLSVRQWAAFADDYMTRMGFTETHLRCYIMHDDSDGQHIHIIANRINMVGGKLYLGKNENLISTRIISELEKVHKLTQTTSAISSHSQEKRKPSRNELMMAERTTTPCPRSTLQSLIDNALTGRPDLLTFIAMLEKVDVSCKPNIASTGKMNGFSFQYQGIAFKASQLGKKYGWSSLQTLIDFVPEHLTLLKQAQKPTVPAPVTVPMPVPMPMPMPMPMPCHHASLKNRLQTGKRFWRKSFSLKKKFVWKDNRKQWVSFSSGANCTIQPSDTPPASPEFVACIARPYCCTSQAQGMSLLHATAHPFHQILHLHL
jgi:hypothetical protein